MLATALIAMIHSPFVVYIGSLFAFTVNLNGTGGSLIFIARKLLCMTATWKTVENLNAIKRLGGGASKKIRRKAVAVKIMFENSQGNRRAVP